MASNIAEGVWWLHGTRGCNVYLIRARDGSFAIVDTGFASNVDAIIEEVEAIGAEPVSAILLTHFHFDHSGCATELAEHFGADVRSGAGDCERTDEGWRLVRHGFGRRRQRAPQNARPIAVCPIETDGEVLPGVRAISTPGHTAGSTSYLVEDAGVALVGDMVICHSDGLSRTLVAANSDDATYLGSIRSFAGIAPEIGCAGHGRPVMEGFQAQLAELAEKPRERLKPWQYPRRFKRLFDFYRFMNRKRRR